MNKEYLIYKLSDEVKNSCKIDKEAFTKFNVKRGLRNDDGSGVLVGLTNIGNVVGYERDADGKLTPTEGKLYYRGYELDDLVSPLLKEKRFGFEEVAFLLLSGQLPDKEELEAFKELLNDNMPLDHRTITHIIELEGSNIMNILARCVLEMYTFDPNPDDISRDNLMRQSIELIAKFPTIIAYASQHLPPLCTGPQSAYSSSSREPLHRRELSLYDEARELFGARCTNARPAAHHPGRAWWW